VQKRESKRSEDSRDAELQYRDEEQNSPTDRVRVESGPEEFGVDWVGGNGGLVKWGNEKRGSARKEKETEERKVEGTGRGGAAEPTSRDSNTHELSPSSST